MQTSQIHFNKKSRLFSFRTEEGIRLIRFAWFAGGSLIAGTVM